MISSDDDLLPPSARKTVKTAPAPVPPPKRKHQRQKSALRITKHDLRVVAPYLWERQKQPRTSMKPSDMPSSIPIVLTDFSMDLADIAQLPQRMYNTANLLKQLTESSGVKLYLVDKILDEIYFCPKGHVVVGHRISWSIRSGKTIAAHVAFSKEFVLVNDVFGDPRFPEGTGWGDPTLTSVICVPVITRNDECSGVIELFRDNGIDYVKLNLDVVTVISGWMGSAIEQQQKRIILERREDINSKLMTLMQRFISNTITFNDVISEILNAAKASINAQRGSFYLLNKSSGELETLTYDEALFESMNNAVLKKLRKKIKGIAHMVVEDGQMLNIADAYKDPRFDKTIDQKSGFLTRSVLCMPIADQAGCTGVIQIINKLPAGAFSNTDEEMFGIFATYCANIVNYKNQFDERRRAVNFNNVYRDLMENRVRFKLIKTPLKALNRETFVAPPDFHSFNWYPFPTYMDDMIELSFHMLTEIMGPHFFNPNTLLSMIITIKQMYRRITYHNFEHAFTFTHCVYCILKRDSNRFDMVEKLAMLLSGLCHDVDHPGYTNVFLKFIDDPLASMYEDSILENHHAFVGSIIIKNTRVLNMLDADTSARFYAQFNANIKSTDLKLHLLDHRIALEAILRPVDEVASLFDWENDQHRQLLRYLIMTTADMAGTSKPFRVAERIAENLFVEFFNQGDRQKAMGITPIPSMDRSLSHMLPEWQINFLRVISLPCFDLIRLVLPDTSPLYTNGKLLKKAWSEIMASRGKKTWHPEKSLARL